MAYKTSELKKNAKEAIKKYKLIFIQDIIDYLGISKDTFYVHFPHESDSYKDLFNLLIKNRIDMKIGMRHKWYNSDNATLQMGFMKLIGTEEERDILNQSDDKKISTNVQYNIINYHETKKLKSGENTNTIQVQAKELPGESS